MSSRGRGSGTVSGVAHGSPAGGERIRAAEVVAALSLATDLAIGVPLEHGLQSALFAMRLSERLNVDPETASKAYYVSLLAYVGCTAGAETAAELFGGEDALTAHAGPSRFGSRAESMAGIMRALAPSDRTQPVRAVVAARKLPQRRQGIQAPRAGVLRGRGDAERPARPVRLRPGAVRPLHRALGRQRRREQREGRRDPAAAADRARGSRYRVPAHARRR